MVCQCSHKCKLGEEYEFNKFCESYGKDSYILSYLFNYQIKPKGKDNISKTGFSKKAIPRVLSKLEEHKIDYLVIDVRNNYDVDDKFENRNLNQYDTIYEKSYVYVKKQRQVREIYDILELCYQANSSINKEKKKELIILILAKIKVIDFLFNLSYDKQIINQKQYYKFGIKIDDITKYTCGWLNSIDVHEN